MRLVVPLFGAQVSIGRVLAQQVLAHCLRDLVPAAIFLEQEDGIVELVFQPGRPCQHGQAIGGTLRGGDHHQRCPAGVAAVFEPQRGEQRTDGVGRLNGRAMLQVHDAVHSLNVIQREPRRG